MLNSHFFLRKMPSQLNGGQVKYSLGDIAIHDFIGQYIQLHYQGKINCISCGGKTRKSYQQGYCYPCFRQLARCDRCMISPEKCHYDEGTCREPDWAQQHCFQTHTIYLANTSGVKVGISRDIPTRWVDQGATQALPIIHVANRYQSGLVECVFKQSLADKTQWRKMLQGVAELVDLTKVRDDLFTRHADELAQLQQQHPDSIDLLTDRNSINLQFPVDSYPQKVVSLNFDKTPDIQGHLLGIKGQYLILDTGVLNIRKFAGYAIECKIFT